MSCNQKNQQEDVDDQRQQVDYTKFIGEGKEDIPGQEKNSKVEVKFAASPDSPTDPG